MSVGRLARGWNWLRRNPVNHWCVLFVALAGIVTMHGNNANPYSRFAMLAAIAEDHSLAMDAYRDSTCDWSRTPDGRYYSNKAPGPALLAVPLYLPIDAAVVAHIPDRPTRDAQRMAWRNEILDILSLTLQAVPFAIVVMLAASALAKRGASRPAIQLAALAMLFGNTAALLMNMFYGHGMAALFTVAMVLALLDGRWALAGLLLGLNVLTDYGSALFAPVLAVMLFAQAPHDWRSLLSRGGRFALGGLGPLVAFLAYHAHCFGGPFTLPNKYQNPVFVEKTGRALWGVIDFFPSVHFSYELLFGNKRSLLVTQPWVLLLAVLLVSMLWRRSRWGAQRWAATGVVLPIAFGGLLLLFLMNASFGGWHGGVCPGPRYLSAALPAVGLALGLAYDTFPRLARLLLWAAVVPAVALFILIWSSDLGLWPQQEIWQRALDVLTGRMSDRTRGRLVLMLSAFALATATTLWRTHRARRDRFRTG
jgi:hypothetical protein